MEREIKHWQTNHKKERKHYRYKWDKATIMATVTTAPGIVSAFRALMRLASRLPEKQRQGALIQIRTQFRSPLHTATLSDKLKEAGEKIAYLRIITPKHRSNSDAGCWIYKDGQPVQASGTTRNGKNVHTNWTGNNLDPCSVKRHKVSLKRAGFTNNLHAKGIF